MGMRRAQGLITGLLVAAFMVGACGLEKSRSPEDAADEDAEYSAEKLGDLDESGSIWHSLDDSERNAVERSGMSGVSGPGDYEGQPDAMAEADGESKMDKAGKVSMSLLLVAVTVGAAAAPFLLF